MNLKNLGFLVCFLCLLILIGCFGQRNKPSFTIARGSDWYNYPLLGKDENLKAFVSELLDVVAVDQNVKFEFITVPPDALMRGLNNEAYQGVITLISPSSLSFDVYSYSEPFFLLGPVLVTQAKSPIQSLKDLEGKTVGILRGSSTAYDIVKYPSVIIIPYESILIALENLNRGEIDAVIMPLMPAYIYTESLYPNRLKVVGGPLTKDGFRIVAKNNQQGHELIELFNKGLKNLQEKGTYEQLIKKWNLYSPAP